MASDPLFAYRKPGFPIFSDTSGEFLSVLEYVGPAVALSGPLITIGMVWADFPGTISFYDYEPAENALYATLKITCSYKYQPGASNASGQTATIATSVRAEVEWVDISRPLAEHPHFESLSVRDMIDVDRWKQEEDPALREAYQYATGEDEGVGLSTLAQKLALGHAMGIESYTDHAPVFRKITTFINGYPPNSGAGQKESPSVPSGSPEPSGYEWVKSADRCVQTGEKNRWDRVEEWTGAKKVLVDKNAIYF